MPGWILPRRGLDSAAAEVTAEVDGLRDAA